MATRTPDRCVSYRARCDDQVIVRGEGIDLRRIMLNEQMGGQTLATQGSAQDFVRDGIDGKGFLVHIDL
jgi:hypothetical protein